MRIVTLEMIQKTSLLVWPPGLPSKENSDPVKWPVRVAREELYMEEDTLTCQAKRISLLLYEEAKYSQRISKIKSKNTNH